MVDVSGIGGTVLGLAGMGIGLGILAHTASNITRMTDRMYEEPPRRRPQYGRPRRLEVTGRDELPERDLFQGTRMRPRRPISRPISRPRPRPITTTHKPRMYDNVWRV